MQIKFYDKMEDSLLKFAVIIAKMDGKYDIKPVCIYSVTAPDEFDGAETFGGLFYAEIKELEKELHSEIERIAFFDEVPQELTYPLIQPKLIDEAKRRGFIG